MDRIYLTYLHALIGFRLDLRGVAANAPPAAVARKKLVAELGGSPAEALVRDVEVTASAFKAALDVVLALQRTTTKTRASVALRQGRTSDASPEEMRAALRKKRRADLAGRE